MNVSPVGVSSVEANVEVRDLLSTLDIVVFVAVLLLTVGAVVYGQIRKKEQLDGSEHSSFLDLLVMGRRLTLPMFVATLVATWYGGIFGVTRIAFEHGVYNFVTQGLFWYISYLIFALFLVDKVSSHQAITLPDLVEKMFGPRSAKLSAVFNFFNVLPVAYAISLGLLLQLIFGGELWQMMSFGVVAVVLYSMWGGFRAVVYSDLIQFFVMCSGVLMVLLFSLYIYGGYNFLTSNLPATHFSFTGGMGLATTLVWGFIALSTLVDPNFYQRCFAAQSSVTAKWGIVISTIIWLCFDICTTLGAMYARAVIPQAEAGYAYLTYAIQILPDGLRGFFLAGILATILSTIDSYIFLAGTTLSFDLAPRKLRGKIATSHIGMVAVGILAIVMGLVFDGNIKMVWKTLGSYSAACLLLPVMCGYIFPGKIRDNQFVLACILGVIATTVWRLSDRSGFLAEVDELYIGMLVTALGILLYHIVARYFSSVTSR